MNRLFSSIIITALACLSANAQIYQVVSINGNGIHIDSESAESVLEVNQNLSTNSVIRNINNGELNIHLREKGTPDCFRIILRDKDEQYSCKEISRHKSIAKNGGRAFTNFIYEQIRTSRKPTVDLSRSTGANFRGLPGKLEEYTDVSHDIVYSLWLMQKGEFSLENLRGRSGDYPIEISRTDTSLTVTNYSDKELNFAVISYEIDQYNDLKAVSFIDDSYIPIEPSSDYIISISPETNRKNIFIIASEKVFSPAILAENMVSVYGIEVPAASKTEVGFAFGSAQ